MTRLIFFQWLEPVTTEHLVLGSHTLTQYTYTQTPCPDLHVCLLVHTGSNDTGASHRSIRSCHSAGNTRTSRVGYTHTSRGVYAAYGMRLHICVCCKQCFLPPQQMPLTAPPSTCTGPKPYSLSSAVPSPSCPLALTVWALM